MGRHPMANQLRFSWTPRGVTEVAWLPVCSMALRVDSFHSTGKAPPRGAPIYLRSGLAGVNYILPLATITSPHRPPIVAWVGECGSCRRGRSFAGSGRGQVGRARCRSCCARDGVEGRVGVGGRLDGLRGWSVGLLLPWWSPWAWSLRGPSQGPSVLRSGGGGWAGWWNAWSSQGPSQEPSVLRSGGGGSVGWSAS